MPVQVDLTVAGHRLIAHSVGGIETCFQLPALDLCLDIGRCPPGAERNRVVLLTHGHIDHAAGLPYYTALRNLLGYHAPKVYCPSEAHGPLQKILTAWTELDACADRCELTPLSPGDVVPLKSDYYAKCFRSPHRIPTLGYTLLHRKKKLRPELHGLPQEQIAERVRRGEAVNEELEIAELCFPGDTRIEVVEREPTVRTARALLLECTFVGKQVSPDKARRGGHIHLEHIAERAELFENEAIVLTHFSRRHSRTEIEDQVAKKLPAELQSRLQLLIHD